MPETLRVLYIVSLLNALHLHDSCGIFLVFVQSPAAAEEHESPRADTPSTVTEVDMDLDSYQIALEEVLTWLLSAEDTFQEQDDISDDVEEVKEQFATHEVRICCCGVDLPAVGPLLPGRTHPDEFCSTQRSGCILGIVIFK